MLVALKESRYAMDLPLCISYDKFQVWSRRVGQRVSTHVCLFLGYLSPAFNLAIMGAPTAKGVMV